MQKIHANITHLGDLVFQIIEIAQKSIFNHDAELDWLQKAREIDREINAIDYQVDNNVTNIIALRQPMGIDLRLVISTLKISVILERMGDLAKNATRRADNIGLNINIELKLKLEKMLGNLKLMLKGAIAAYTNQDREQIHTICSQDNELDELYTEILADTQAQMQQKTDAVNDYLHIIMIAKNLERMGDYAAKIAKITYYIITGESFPNEKNYFSQYISKNN